jgi:N-acetylglucosaminyldiphosphoundecaprenol N-acetyl-beta-D-mannosaminyltransferase
MKSTSAGESETLTISCDLLARVPVEVVGGVSIAALDRQQTAQLLIDVALAVKSSRTEPVLFTSANGQVLSAVASAANPSEVAAMIGGADVISADGQPLVFASKLLGRGRLRERCATTDLFHDVARMASARGASFYLLGGTESENKASYDNVRRLYPGLNIVGRRHGYFASAADERATVERISSIAPDVLWVGMGFPREQEFCSRWRGALTGVGALKTCGGLFGFLSGAHSRAPLWMQNAGLEWAYRLGLEPRRLLPRYASTNLKAAWLLVTRSELFLSHWRTPSDTAR